MTNLSANLTFFLGDSNLTLDPGLIKAGRAGIEVLLKLKGTNVVLTRPGTKVEQPGGGYKPEPGIDLAEQRFSVSDQTSTSSAKNLGDIDSGVTLLTRTLMLTGRYNATAPIGSQWSDGQNRYRVDEMVVDSQWQRKWLCTQVGPDPSYG